MLGMKCEDRAMANQDDNAPRIEHPTYTVYVTVNTVDDEYDREFFEVQSIDALIRSLKEEEYKAITSIVLVVGV